jgi:hypothetical protein
MKIKTLRNKFVVAVAIGAILSASAPSFPGIAYSAVAEATATGNISSARLSDGPAIMTGRKIIADQKERSGKIARVVPAVPTGGVVTEWNQTAANLAVLPASALAPVQQGRVMAIVQVAVHDAVNGITGRYATYLPAAPAPANASPEAAAIAAAHYALRNLFPSQAGALDTLYFASLAAHFLSASDPGIAYGQSAAAAILAARANDNSAQAQYNYTAPGAGTPGVWVPLTSAPALLPGWGNVTPFVLRHSSQFGVDPPPALDSEQYATDYNEIKQIGKLVSPTRTAEQSNIALFWRASPTAIWNPVLTEVLAARNFDISATARAFALMYLAAADAGIACWQVKYTYNFWRPQPAIRAGDADGNDLTAGDPTWLPFITTPAHPDYTSGHSTNSSAMATILELEFGENPGVPLMVTLTGITRQWETFNEAVDEVIDARVYSGIHFRTADEVGARQGRQIGHFVWTHALRPCPKGKGKCFPKDL